MEQNKQLTEQRKRKFLIMLPLLTVPFIGLLFYSLGGGKGKSNPMDHRSSALSTTLPDPLLDQQPMDKLSIYERAAKDSAEQQKTEDYGPFANWMPVDTSRMLPSARQNPFSYSPNAPIEMPTASLNLPPKKTPEAELEQKIAQLEKALQSPNVPVVADTTPHSLPAAGISPELQRLETLMQSLSIQSAPPDPELVRAESLMDKILDIQHPERARQRIKGQSVQNKTTAYPVSALPKEGISDLLADSMPHRPMVAVATNGFYDEDPAPAAEQNALLAAVHESQTLVSGATLKIRLEQDAYVQGQLIPKGGSVFGICTLNGERLEVAINSIRNGNSIYPVSLIAYDMDGLPGIRIPDSINRDASKESSERAIQTLNMGSLDPSIGAQATAAGIEAAKNLLSRKVKLIKVVVKAGYPLLLASNKSNF